MDYPYAKGDDGGRPDLSPITPLLDNLPRDDDDGSVANRCFVLERRHVARASIPRKRPSTLHAPATGSHPLQFSRYGRVVSSSCVDKSFCLFFWFTDPRFVLRKGSPDPDGRQIDGLGGGVSSLSKAAVISQPGEGLNELCEPWKGVDWADEGRRGDLEWDVVYRLLSFFVVLFLLNSTL
jgi:hypothetical protein